MSLQDKTPDQICIEREEKYCELCRHKFIIYHMKSGKRKTTHKHQGIETFEGQ